MASPEATPRPPKPSQQRRQSSPRISLALSVPVESHELPSRMSHVFEGARDLLLTYQLPPLVASVQRNWYTSLKIGAIVSAILALVSIQLLMFYKYLIWDGRLGSHPRASKALIILSYSSFLLHLSSTSTALLLLDKLGHLTDVASERQMIERVPQTGYIATNSRPSVLNIYGLTTCWKIVLFHWILCSLSGLGCLLAQVVLYVSMDEILLVQVIATSLVGVSILPGLFLLMSRRKRGNDKGS
ncbi:hypothetical protein PM082_016233 [Marasmius tenuissimus]|nr:hypothetical protein PM082_016233 [Marasmius tenuissimus]